MKALSSLSPHFGGKLDVWTMSWVFLSASIYLFAFRMNEVSDRFSRLEEFFSLTDRLDRIDNEMKLVRNVTVTAGTLDSFKRLNDSSKNQFLETSKMDYSILNATAEVEKAIFDIHALQITLLDEFITMSVKLTDQWQRELDNISGERCFPRPIINPLIHQLCPILPVCIPHRDSVVWIRN
jgi:hypothetical protein